MIINKEINPQRNLYYIGAQIIKVLKKTSEEEIDMLDVYNELLKEKGLTIGIFILALDWLYLLDIIHFEKGLIRKCF